MRRLVALLGSIAILFGIGSCSTLRARAEKPRAGEEHLIVDCLPPPRMVTDPNLGVVALPRPPLKTTASDCLEQGGQYDTSDPRWPLKVWTPAAERGDAEAQYHVGEVYERGLEAGPEFARAARWYRRAAEQTHRPAAANLARLYERGLGVRLDWAEALRWYQLASGIEDPRTSLEQTEEFLRKVERRHQELQDELERLRQPNRGPHSGDPPTVRYASLYLSWESLTRALSPGNAAEKINPNGGRRTTPPLAQHLRTEQEAEKRIDEILEELRSLEAQSPQLRARIATLMKRALAEARQATPAAAASTLDPASVRRALGKYYALVIGNENYLEWPKLETPISDAMALRQILEERYGFEKPVEVVEDGRAQTILDKLDEVRRLVNAQAESAGPVNVLLFYAGHGAHRYPIQGHWIPIDGPREFSSRWIADTQIAEQLRAMKARQILVIADSCYASTLAARGVLIESRSPTLAALVNERPRMVLASGGDRPVYEPIGAQHSIFARALVDVLRENHGMIMGEDLFRRIEPRVRREAARLGVEQQPQYLPILDSDHESGDFVLVAAD